MASATEKIYRIKESELKKIGDAIRFKNGTTEGYTVAEMPEAIKANTGGAAYIVDNDRTIVVSGTYQGNSLLITENTLLNLREYLEKHEFPLDIQINVSIPEGYVNTTDGTALSNDLLLGKVAYSQATKLIGTIETYNYSFSIGESEEPETPEEPEGLTEQEIEALNNMKTELTDELSISYDKEILDISFKLQDNDLVVNNNMEEVTFKINNKKDLEVTY